MRQRYDDFWEQAIISIVFSTEIGSLLDFLILDPRKFNRFSIENGNIVWGKNWDLMFPIEQLHDGVLL